MMTSRATFALSLACAVPSCAVEEPPAPRWSYVYPAILQPACATAGCHATLAATAGVDLGSREGAYTVLTGRICGEPTRPSDPPRNFVTPFAAEASQLTYQLRGVDARGRRYRDVMPPDLPLPDDEVALVEAWIDAGARCD